MTEGRYQHPLQGLHPHWMLRLLGWTRHLPLLQALPPDLRHADAHLLRGELMTPTFWNGAHADAIRGTAIVADSPEFPQFWAKTEGIIGERIAVVRVDYCKHVTYLDNRTGDGWAKVTEGHGSPRWSHSDLDIEPHSFVMDGLS